MENHNVTEENRVAALDCHLLPSYFHFAGLQIYFVSLQHHSYLQDVSFHDFAQPSQRLIMFPECPPKFSVGTHVKYLIF